MSKVNLFRSAFSDKSKEISFDKEAKIKDLLPELDFENSIIIVNGFQKDENYILKIDDICAIRIFPAGDSGWNSLDSILTIAAFVVGTVVTGGWLGLVVGAGAAAVYAGSSLALDYFGGGDTIGEWLLKKSLPENGSSSSADAQENLPTINGAKNQSALDKPIPFIMGRHLMTGYYIGKPYANISGEDGEEQYYQFALLLGYNKLKVSDIRLGQTRLATNPDNIINGIIPIDTDSVYSDENFNKPRYAISLELKQDGTDLSLYPCKVTEDACNIQLLRTQKDDEKPFYNEPKRFSARNPMKVEVEIDLGALISYNDKGEKQDASVEICIQYRWNTLASDNQGWKTFGQLKGSNSYNSLTGVSRITRQKAKQMRFVASRSFNYSEVPKLENSLYPSAMIEIKVFKVTNDPTDNRTSESVVLGAIRTWSYDLEKSNKEKKLVAQRLLSDDLIDKVAILGFKCKASSDLSGQLNSINCVVQSYARIWNQTTKTWSTEESPTNNPASIALKVLQSELLKDKKVSDEQIDLDAFGELYEFCEDRHPNDLPEDAKINKRGYVIECNGVLTQKQKMQDLLTKILWTARSFWTVVDNKITVITDKAKSNFVTILNNQNVLKASNSKNFDEIPDGYKVTFIDETDLWQQNTMYINFDDGTTIQKAGYTYEPTEAVWQTHRNQVWHNHLFEGSKKFLRPEVWSRTVSIDGHIIGVGDLVLVQDDTIVVGIGDGAEITGFITDESDTYITHIITDSYFNIADLSQKYGLKILQTDGTNEPSIRTVEVIISEAGYFNVFELKDEIWKNNISIVPTVGDIVAFGIYDKITTSAICVDKKSNNDNTFELTLMPYSTDVYKYEKNIEIPVFDSKITVPQPIAGITEIPVEAVTKDDLFSIVNSVYTGGDTGNPLQPIITNVMAGKDSISLSCFSTGKTLVETMTSTIWEYRKSSEQDWVVLNETNSSGYYVFNRKIDGYVEKDVLREWQFRAKAVNTYGKESLYSEVVNVDVSEYLTWLPPPIDIEGCTAEKDGIVMRWNSNPQYTYGDLRFRYEISYNQEIIASKKGIISYNDTYIFDRDSDGYPEKSSVIARLEELGLPPGGRDLSLYSIKIFSYVTQTDREEVATTDVNTQYYGTWVPADIESVKAIARRDNISFAVSAQTFPTHYGTPYRYIFEYTKDGIIWNTVNSEASSFVYYFDRDIDGYPEATELAQWRFRAKAISTAGKESLTWGGSSHGVTPILDDYGTWIVGTPVVNTRISDRTVTLLFSQEPRADNILPYGDIVYTVEIQRPDIDSTWFKPATDLNPFDSETNYKNGEGYIIAERVYSQVMPLIGQTDNDIIDTLYRFRISAKNEASRSEFIEINATATCTSIRDIVKANETTKRAYISTLSAISANIGNISQGSLSGSDNNKWDLSTFVDDNGIHHYEGVFRVGGKSQYINIKPVLDEQGNLTGEFNITIKVGSFEISSTASIINGEFIVQVNNDSLDRTRITPFGTYYEHRESLNSAWSVISQMRTDGIKAQSLYSEKTLVLTNKDLQHRRLAKIDIGRPYLSDSSRVWHFDTDNLDQYQQEGLVINAKGEAILVDQYNTTDTTLDFTPAILAVAPYSEIGRSLYGLFSASLDIGITNTLTVDFWIQYIWAENQVLFDVGNSEDRVRLVVRNDEIYFNEPLKDEVPFNQEQIENGTVYVFNEPAAASSFIQHYGANLSPDANNTRTFTELGLDFEKNKWLHVGIVLSSQTINVFLDTIKVSFSRYSQGIGNCDLFLNNLQNTFLLDELFVDTQVAEEFEDFISNTKARIPWGGLDSKQKFFVLEADNLITNIFDSDLFKEKVSLLFQEFIKKEN